MFQSLLWLLKAIFNAIVHDLWPAIKSVLKSFLAFLRWLCANKKKRKPFSLSSCVPIPHPNFKRPDPLIYDQYYLMSLGLAVSWQNPDIEILQGGAPVASTSELQPATNYTVRARIWNGSTDGVCAGMPVTFSYLSFGVGTESHPIGATAVNLGVKGSASCPAYAEMNWLTPATPGHYCVQVSFAWPDDLNPFNNLGQENTEVVKALSPGSFSFALRNSDTERKSYRFEADTYQIPPQPQCSDQRSAGKAPSKTVSAATRARNSRSANPLPAGWTIAFDPATPVLDPGQEIEILTTISPLDSFHGSQAVNIHTFSGYTLIGGVTITLQRS
jgi:hypothetical protein